MKEIKAKWGSHIVEAYHQVLLSDEPCYTEFNGVYITNVAPFVGMNEIVSTEEIILTNYGKHKTITDNLSRPVRGNETRPEARDTAAQT